MPEPFLVTANVTNAIKNILEHYPLVDGPIRELLQNSDDARATKQVHILLDLPNQIVNHHHRSFTNRYSYSTADTIP